MSSAYLYPNRELRLDRLCFEMPPTGIMTIGRHPANTVSVLVANVSRHHAAIELQPDGTFVLRDTGSSNGTFLNGVRVEQEQPLQEGDEIVFGQAGFTFSMMPPEEYGAADASAMTHAGYGINFVRDEPNVIYETQIEVPDATTANGNIITGRTLGNQALQRLAIMYRLSEATNESLTRDDFLSRMLDLVFEALPADRAAVLLSRDPQEMPRPVMVRYRDPDTALITGAGDENRPMLNISRTIVQQCANERVGILSCDTTVDERFRHSESLFMSGIHSAMCVPLLYRNGPMGVLFVDSNSPERRFSREDLMFLASFALDAALTMANFNLTRDLVKQERLAAVGMALAGLSHNIKNVLQLTKGGLDLMEMALGKDDMKLAKDYWPILQRGVTRMNTVTQEILAFSSQNKPELRPTDCAEVVREIARNMTQTATDNHIDLQVDIQEDLPLYNLDETTLTKALMNLLTNAIDAMSTMPGMLILSVRQISATGGLCITVSDNGPGIPQESFDKIWEPFYSTKGSKGTGLGLPMTQKYIREMNGTIEATTGNEGTTFIIIFPPSA